MKLGELEGILKEFEDALDRIERKLKDLEKPGLKKYVLRYLACVKLKMVKVLEGDAEVLNYYCDERLKHIVFIILVRSWASTPKGKKYIRLHITYDVPGGYYDRIARPYISPEETEPMEIPEDFIKKFVDYLITNTSAKKSILRFIR